ncbi:hypothetical protein GCM10007877_08700 [Marinibactrum halimedae]|uniref:Uncharacterized protein n=1 Tax=Marinibactrum halimedae TaxID=1444977 RepID=A0AA37T3Y9_9GAMM|nr:hypothetical protein GCM10007877_08700 [Marinibactrum halimedae]
MSHSLSQFAIPKWATYVKMEMPNDEMRSENVSTKQNTFTDKLVSIALTVFANSMGHPF